MIQKRSSAAFLWLQQSCPIEWAGSKINLLDTPGTFDFVGEIKQALRVVDGCLFVTDAVAGVEVGTELTWEYADEYSLPRMVLINKMDRENASFDRALNALRDRFDGQFVPFLLPIGSQSTFEGVVDVVKMKALMGADGKLADVPADMADQVEELRVQLIEAAAESDDELIMKYLEGEELTEQEIHEGLLKSVASGALVPVLCAAGLTGIGVQAVLDAVVAYLPPPAASVTATNAVTEEPEELEAKAGAPLSALVFKTTVDPYGKQSYFRVYSGAMESDSRVFNVDTGEEERLGQLGVPRGKEQIPVARIVAGDIGVVTKLSNTDTGQTLCDKDHPVKLAGLELPVPIFSVAVSPATKADSAKMGSALSRLVEEDPTFEWHLERSTRQTILSGMGDAHIDIGCRRLKRKFGVEVITAIPKVPYRETITRPSTGDLSPQKADRRCGPVCAGVDAPGAGRARNGLYVRVGSLWRRGFAVLPALHRKGRQERHGTGRPGRIPDPGHVCRRHRWQRAPGGLEGHRFPDRGARGFQAGVLAGRSRPAGADLRGDRHRPRRVHGRRVERHEHAPGPRSGHGSAARAECGHGTGAVVRDAALFDQLARVYPRTRFLHHDASRTMRMCPAT